VATAASVFRIVLDLLVGLLLAGLVAGIAVPMRPGAFGPATALALTILCVGVVVWIDWRFLQKR
jgi:hypothetical protein